jgi:hypothetical protein
MLKTLENKSRTKLDLKEAEKIQKLEETKFSCFLREGEEKENKEKALIFSTFTFACIAGIYTGLAMGIAGLIANNSSLMQLASSVIGMFGVCMAFGTSIYNFYNSRKRKNKS